MYRSAKTGKYYVFVTSKEGTVQQWELFESTGRIDARLVRTLEVGSQTEGCVADDETGTLYVAEEEVGIWKYGAEPDSDPNRTAVDSVGAGGHLIPDIEGLALYIGKNGEGYLLASSQGDSRFVVYRREGNNEFVGSFRITEGRGIDAVSHTDGIEVTGAYLGPDFPEGVFIAQDDQNDGANQNFKLTPWGAVAQSATPPLLVAGNHDPRKP
jgi:3-phytase